MTSFATFDTCDLPGIALTSEEFRAYGQVLYPQVDGKGYDCEDAQLDISQGIPRFYLMRLEQRGMDFSRMTRHQRCTQCLGALQGKRWWLAVAPPAAIPSLDQLRVFEVSGGCFVKLHRGTWHAGPYFGEEWLDFYNLELSDTNVVDHDNYDFVEHLQLRFRILPAQPVTD